MKANITLQPRKDRCQSTLCVGTVESLDAYISTSPLLRSFGIRVWHRTSTERQERDRRRRCQSVLHRTKIRALSVRRVRYDCCWVSPRTLESQVSRSTEDGHGSLPAWLLWLRRKTLLKFPCRDGLVSGISTWMMHHGTDDEKRLCKVTPSYGVAHDMDACIKRLKQDRNTCAFPLWQCDSMCPSLSEGDHLRPDAIALFPLYGKILCGLPLPQ